MFVCKDCGSKVTVTENERRLTLPRYHVVCDSCGAERNVNIDAPTANGSNWV